MMLVTVADSIRMLTRVADGILSAGGKCLTLLERFKADESTMTFKVADREPTKVPGVSKALAVTSTSLEATAHQSAPTKMLQSHRSIAGLFETSDGNRVLIECNTPMPLQVMSSTRMEVYARCFELTAFPLSDLSPKFNRHLRLCLSDGDASIGAFFRYLRAQNPSISQWTHQCDIHKTSNRVDDATKLPAWQHHIGALIAFAKSLENANAMRQYREALRLALAARLQWRRRAPKASNLKRNAFLLRLCIGGKRRQISCESRSCRCCLMATGREPMQSNMIVPGRIAASPVRLVSRR